MTVHKVTAFITRTGRQWQPQLLLFQHPQAGVQLPADTVEVGEDWQTAVLREAQEETDLTRLTIQRYLDLLPLLGQFAAQTHRRCPAKPLARRRVRPACIAVASVSYRAAARLGQSLEIGPILRLCIAAPSNIR